MQDGDRVGNGSSGKRTVRRSDGGRSREREAVWRDLIEISKDVVAKARREEAGSWETGDRRWEKTNLTETHADPAARVDGVVVKGRRGGSHVKAPGSRTEAES